MRKRILLIEDNAELSEIITAYLEREGLSVNPVYDLESAVDFLSRQAVDLIILDINLPDGDGLNFLRELRRDSKIPVIFASARTSESDRVQGFHLGGDDYLPKPYSLTELYLRVKALLRRSYGEAEELLVCGDIKLDVAGGEAYLGGDNLKLSPKEFDLLYYFMKNPNKILSKEELINSVWGTYSDVEQSTLTVHVRWLREKMEKDPAHPEILLTVWGKGYKFVCEKETD